LSGGMVDGISGVHTGPGRAAMRCVGNIARYDNTFAVCGFNELFGFKWRLRELVVHS
jgi:hypothetical protein